MSGERAQQNAIPDELYDSDEVQDLTVVPGPEGDIFKLVDLPEWITPKQLAAGYARSLGMTQSEAGAVAGVDRTTVWRWENDDEKGQEFCGLINRLSFHSGIANRSVRLQWAKRMAQHLFEKELKEGQRRHTALDWMRYVGELSGDKSERPDHPVIQFINELFQVNVGGAGVGLASEVVEGEVKEVEDGEGTETAHEEG